MTLHYAAHGTCWYWADQTCEQLIDMHHMHLHACSLCLRAEVDMREHGQGRFSALGLEAWAARGGGRRRGVLPSSAIVRSGDSQLPFASRVTEGTACLGRSVPVFEASDCLFVAVSSGSLVRRVVCGEKLGKVRSVSLQACDAPGVLCFGRWPSLPQVTNSDGCILCSLPSFLRQAHRCRAASLFATVRCPKAEHMPRLR